jgi:hypothetical protein
LARRGTDEESDMDKLVKRVTLVKRSSAGTEAVRVYKSRKKKKRKVSALVAPLERTARKLVKSNVVLGQETIRRSNKANRRRRDGWFFDGPVIIAKSTRSAYNTARKAVPLGLLPKA